MKNIVEISVHNALKNISKLPNTVLDIDGMSSSKIRCLLNNICHYNNVNNYLEIGTWKGSTIISASYKNKGNFIGIDNFKYFNGSRQDLDYNIHLFKNDCNITFYENNCWEFDKTLLPKINVYFYDGKHDEESQYNAFVHFNDILDNEFIAIVDDWNVQAVQSGTKKAFSDLNYNVSYEWHKFTNYNGDVDDFWNGLYIGVINK